MPAGMKCINGTLSGFWFSALVATASKFTFHGTFFYMLKYLPKTFTFGEAFIVSQGLTLFLLNVFLKFSSSIFLSEFASNFTDMERMTTILQVGLFGVAFLVGCCHFVPYFRGIAFYTLLAIVGFVIVLFPIDDNFAAIVLLEFILADMRRVRIIDNIILYPLIRTLFPCLAFDNYAVLRPAHCHSHRGDLAHQPKPVFEYSCAEDIPRARCVGVCARFHLRVHIPLHSERRGVGADDSARDDASDRAVASERRASVGGEGLHRREGRRCSRTDAALSAHRLCNANLAPPKPVRVFRR